MKTLFSKIAAFARTVLIVLKESFNELVNRYELAYVFIDSFGNSKLLEILLQAC